jgi:hypothetical protein
MATPSSAAIYSILQYGPFSLYNISMVRRGGIFFSAKGKYTFCHLEPDRSLLMVHGGAKGRNLKASGGKGGKEGRRTEKGERRKRKGIWRQQKNCEDKTEKGRNRVKRKQTGKNIRNTRRKE